MPNTRQETEQPEENSNSNCKINDKLTAYNKILI